jgi:hypothetical protein
MREKVSGLVDLGFKYTLNVIIIMTVIENIRGVGRRAYSVIKNNATRDNLRKAITITEGLSRASKGLQNHGNPKVRDIAKRVPVEKLDTILGIAKNIQHIIGDSPEARGERRITFNENTVPKTPDYQKMNDFGEKYAIESRARALQRINQRRI